MIVFDFSVGPDRLAKTFAEDTIVFKNIDAKFDHPDTQAFMELDAQDLVRKYGRPDFIWSSPPCVTFSVASQAHHWTGGKLAYIPKTQAAADNQKIVLKLRQLIEDLNPTYGFIIENPRGILRKLPLLNGINRWTVTYCRYGHESMKPTDLWGELDGWTPRAMCHNGNPDHLSAPKGSRGGTMLRHKSVRAEIPEQLTQEIREQLQRLATARTKQIA